MREKITLSERTIKGDISSMRSDKALGYNAPIAYDRSEKSYYYTDRSYSITEAPISKSEAEELANMITLMRQFTGFKHLTGIENILHKLELLVYESMNKTKQIVQLEQPTVIPGQEWLDPLYKAIKQEKAITIRYQPFNRKASNVLISPMLLKEYQNRWFLFALKNSSKELRTYGLERIISITPSNREYVHSKAFDPKSYFDDIIGVTLEPHKRKVKVKFEVKGVAVNYIRTKPIHHSQIELDATKGKATFQVEVIPNYELRSVFNSFGKALKVV